MKTRLFFCCITILIVSSCSKNKHQNLNSSLYKIDLSNDAMAQSEAPKLSSFFSKIEYIKLETTENSLVAGNHRVYISPKYIYTVAFRQILQFDRKDGHFIKEMGHYGYDPEGYMATLPDVQPINKDEPVVLTAKNIRKINSSNQLETIAPKMASAQNFAALDSNTFVGYLPNYDCKQKYRLVIYSKDGLEIKKFLNYQQCEKPNSLSFSFDLSEGRFYHRGSNVFFKETYNDTIFQVSKDSLTKHAYFHLGEYSIPYKDKETLTPKNTWNKISIAQTFESDRYIFFNYRYKNSTYYSIFDKETQTSFIPDNTSIENGVMDDINHFLDFKPISINNNEVIGSIYPHETLSWFDSNKANLNNLPQSIRQLKDVKPDDNPIVAIATLK